MHAHYGAGDLNGLRRVGADRGCLRPLGRGAVPSMAPPPEATAAFGIRSEFSKTISAQARKKTRSLLTGEATTTEPLPGYDMG